MRPNRQTKESRIKRGPKEPPPTTRRCWRLPDRRPIQAHQVEETHRGLEQKAADAEPRLALKRVVHARLEQVAVALEMRLRPRVREWMCCVRFQRATSREAITTDQPQIISKKKKKNTSVRRLPSNPGDQAGASLGVDAACVGLGRGGNGAQHREDEDEVKRPHYYCFLEQLTEEKAAFKRGHLRPRRTGWVSFSGGELDANSRAGLGG